MPRPVIKIKRNNAGIPPTALMYGELAADIYNRKLYIGDNQNTPILLADGNFAGSGIYQLQFRVQTSNGADNVFQITPAEYQTDPVLDFTLDIKSQTSNYFFAAPIASNGHPSFRRIMPADFASGSANGKYLTSDGTTFSWSSVAGGGGSVTSVGLTLPDIFAVTNSPVTGSGTLTASLASQIQKTFFAAPSSTNGAPSFRAITASDIPTLNQNTTGTAANVSGIVDIANGGTGASTANSALSNLGATTIGANLVKLTNPSAVRFPRFNADNSVSALSAADFRTEIGAGTGGGTVTSVALSTSNSSIFGVTATAITTSGTLNLSLNDQNANRFLCGPSSGTATTPTFRAITPADLASGGTSGLYLRINSSSGFEWAAVAGGGGSPSGANGQIQLVVGGVFDSLTNFQILTNSSQFSKSNIITVPTQNTTYSKINFPFNNIFSENDIVGIAFNAGATTNYVIRNVTNTSFKVYALPTSSGSDIGSLQTFSGLNTSSIQLSPSSNSSTPVFFTGSLSTTKDSDNPSTITVAAGVSNFRVGMQITSGVRPVIIRGIIVDTTQTGSQTYSFAETLSTTTYPVGCYVDVLRSGRSLDSNSNASTYAYSGLLNADNAYISARANTSITLNTYITGTFNTDDTASNNPTKKTDTTIVVDLVVYPRGSIRPNTFITHIDASTNTLTLNQPQFRGGSNGTSSVTITGHAAHPERRVFSFGTPLYNTSSEILTNESISLVKQLNDAGRNLEQKILFKSPEAYTIAVSSLSGATATLSTKNNLLEMSVGDIVLYGTTNSGDTQHTPNALTFISEIDYNLGKITLNALNTLPTSITQLTIRSCRHVKSVIEHRAFPFDNYVTTRRFTNSNTTKAAHDQTYSGYLDYATSSNSYETNIWSGQKGSGNNLGSINDMGLYICSDTAIKIGMSSLARGANTDNKSIKEPVDTLTSHITIEPTRVSSNEVYNGIYVKNLTVTNKSSFDNTNYLYLLGCRSSTPRKNDGYNYLTWYRIATTSISTLVGGAGTTVNPKEDIGEFGIEPQLEISLADEVPINTSLSVPLIKGTAGGDLNITTSNPDTDIILAIPPNNTDIVLSTGSIYITSGLDGGDVYVQSAEDVYLTSQNVRVSGNLIVDGYIQSGTGFQGDNTDAEEPITGLVMDGGTF